MSESGQGGAGRREVAWRVFAAEYDDADLDYSESDEERAPNYVVTPTGARVNRLFVVGVLTEVEQVSDEVLRGRVVDPTGAFVLYAGQYQPDEMAFLESVDPPMFVAVTGKARTFSPDDSDRVFTSVRPESINEVDADTRDRWVVQTAEQTLARVATFARALEADERGEDLQAALAAGGTDAGLAAGIPLAIEHYGTTKAYLAAVRDLAIDAVRVVAGEIDADEVGPLDVDPDEDGDVTVDFDRSPSGVAVGDVAAVEPQAGADAGPASEAGAPEGSTEPESAAGTGGGESGTAEDELGDAPTSGVESAEAEDAEAEAEPDEPPAVEDADDAADRQEAVGDDEPPTVEPEQETTTDESFEPETEDGDEDLGTGGAGEEMYEFDDEEREAVEEEYGLEFSSGSEVDEPGESGMASREPDGRPGDEDRHAEPTSEAVDTDEFQDVESASGGTEAAVDADEEAPAGSETAAAEAPGASVAEDEGPATDEEAADADDEGAGPAPEDLEDAMMDEMRNLDEGDGVERETLLAAVVQSHDVTPAEVEDALESALMAGRCYESSEDTFTPI